MRERERAPAFEAKAWYVAVEQNIHALGLLDKIVDVSWWRERQNNAHG